MTTIILFFIPVLMLVVLANMGQVSRSVRGITYAILLLISTLIAFGGIQLTLATAPILEQILSPDVAINQSALGEWLAVSGLLATLLVLVSLIVEIKGREWQIRGVAISRPVQLTALVLAILYAGGNFALVRALPDPSLLAKLDLQFGVNELLAQNLGLAALAFLGVGLGIRRDVWATFRRLAIRRLHQKDIMISLVLTLGMVFISALMGGLITLLFPGSADSTNALNEALISAFNSPGRAVVLGLLTGIGEELLYRGAFQPVFGLGFTSLVFAFHHVQYLNPAFLLIFMLGLILGWIRNRWGVSVAALTHACYNATLVLLALSAAQVNG